MIKWNHIMDCQPEHGRLIIQINDIRNEENKSFDNFIIGINKYYQNCSWQDLLNAYGDNPPDFWWVYPEDFPFPENKDKI
jgi:hypothetical protein